MDGILGQLHPRRRQPVEFMPHLELSNISKSFGQTRAVQELSIAVDRGEILSILGPSGCGKTTTLRMIAGLEQPTSGRIFSNQKEITRIPAQLRNMGLVFQNYALFPHLDVFENIAFGLRTRRIRPESHVKERVHRALAGIRPNSGRVSNPTHAQ